MDKQDCEQYAKVYRLLADVLVREPPVEEHHMSFILGDLARRIFVGTPFIPPDEILEETSHVIRTGDAEHRKRAAGRLREHADHLNDLAANWQDLRE